MLLLYVKYMSGDRQCLTRYFYADSVSLSLTAAQNQAVAYLFDSDVGFHYDPFIRCLLWVIMAERCSRQRDRLHVTWFAMVAHQISRPAHVPVNTHKEHGVKWQYVFHLEDGSNACLRNFASHPSAFPWPQGLLIWYDMIYSLTAIGLPPGGSSTVHNYTQTIHRTTQWNRIPIR